MRRLFFVFSLISFAAFAPASDFTKASVFTGSPGRIVSEALEYCEAGCRIVLTNTNGPMRTEFRTVKTGELVGAYPFTAPKRSGGGLYAGLPASRVPTVSYAGKPTDGSVYTNVQAVRGSFVFLATGHSFNLNREKWGSLLDGVAKGDIVVINFEAGKVVCVNSALRAKR